MDILLETDSGVPDAVAVDNAWSDMGIDPIEVRCWMTAVLPGRDFSNEPPVTLNRKDWSLVAKFLASDESGPADVVYKTTLLSEFRHGPAVFSLLTKHCMGQTPHLLAWREAAGRSEMLFHPFSGISVGATGSFDALLEMARTLARIQSRVARIPTAETADLPVLAIRDVPGILDHLVENITQTYQGYWNADGGTIRNEFGVPPDLVEQLAVFRPLIETWAAMLEQAGPALSLDHVDFLPHNAVAKEDGSVLIYDWEQAVWSCPFFSLDILLAFAQNFDETRAQSEDGQAFLVLGEEQDTPASTALRQAYLEAFEWGTMTEREAAFDLALCLSPVRYAYAEGLLAKKFGHEQYHAEDLAWWIMRALRRWKRQVDREDAEPRMPSDPTAAFCEALKLEKT